MRSPADMGASRAIASRRQASGSSSILMEHDSSGFGWMQRGLGVPSRGGCVVEGM